MKKIIKRRKAYLTKLYQLSKSNDLPFTMLIQVVKQKAETKRIDRKIRRYSIYFDWQSAEMDILGLLVNKCSIKDGEVLSVYLFSSKNELPQHKQHLWQENSFH